MTASETPKTLTVRYLQRGWRFRAVCAELGIEVNGRNGEGYPGRSEAEGAIALAIAKHLAKNNLPDLPLVHLATEPDLDSAP